MATWYSPNSTIFSAAVAAKAVADIARMERFQNKYMILKYIGTLAFLCQFSLFASAQFCDAAGTAGSTAIYKDSNLFVAWATDCTVQRGLRNAADATLGYASVGDSSMATGAAGTNGVVSLGDGGIAILRFAQPIKNGNGFDFAVFENGFSNRFLELAFVEVSSDGIHFIRFPATSNTQTDTQIAAFDTLINPTQINNLAGKYRANYGTPFDLQELAGTPNLDIDNITHIKIIDVTGAINVPYATFDANNHAINDPFPTPFASGGFDLDAVGVIHQNTVNTQNSNNLENNISVSPNPFTDQIHIDIINNYDENTAKNIQIIDFFGNIILQKNIDSSTIISVLNDLPVGFYCVKISDSTGDFCIKKLLRVSK